MFLSTPQLQSAPGPVEGGVLLSGKRYRLRVAWSARTPGWPLLEQPDGAWYADVFAADGTPITRRRLVRVTDDLFGLLSALAGMPPGVWRVVRPGGGDALPTLYELGSDALIEYVEPSEGA